VGESRRPVKERDIWPGFVFAYSRHVCTGRDWSIPQHGFSIVTKYQSITHLQSSTLKPFHFLRTFRHVSSTLVFPFSFLQHPKKAIHNAHRISRSRLSFPRCSISDVPTRFLLIIDSTQRVYALLRQIPSGRVTTYAAIAKALHTAPRAIGGALRVNPYAPQTPCHRVVQADGVSNPPFSLLRDKSRAGSNIYARSIGWAQKQKRRFKISGGTVEENKQEALSLTARFVQMIGGFMGEAYDAPSGQNRAKKETLLKEEGVLFDDKGKLLDMKRMWSGFEV
jgi:O-6-methylguanine DNA methyltransferase